MTQKNAPSEECVFCRTHALCSPPSSLPPPPHPSRHCLPTRHSIKSLRHWNWEFVKSHLCLSWIKNGIVGSQSSYSKQFWETGMAELSLTTVRLYGKTGACMRMCVCVCVCTVCVFGRRWGWGWGLSPSFQRARFKCDLNKGVALSCDNGCVLFLLYRADGDVSGLGWRFVTNIIQVLQPAVGFHVF